MSRTAEVEQIECLEGAEQGMVRTEVYYIEWNTFQKFFWKAKYELTNFRLVTFTASFDCLFGFNILAVHKLCESFWI